MNDVRGNMETEKTALIENHRQVTGDLTSKLTTAKTEVCSELKPNKLTE